MWPFDRRPRELTVVVKHEIVGLDLIADALKDLAKAQRYAAKSQSGRIVPKRKTDEPDDPEWSLFLAKNDWREPAELQHMEWAYRVLLGRERSSEEDRSEAITIYSRWRHAGVDLPEIDGRSVPVRPETAT
jgi:hypothetical protein